MINSSHNSFFSSNPPLSLGNLPLAQGLGQALGQADGPVYTKKQRLLFELTHFYLRSQKKVSDVAQRNDSYDSLISQEN